MSERPTDPADKQYHVQGYGVVMKPIYADYASDANQVTSFGDEILSDGFIDNEPTHE